RARVGRNAPKIIMPYRPPCVPRVDARVTPVVDDFAHVRGPAVVGAGDVPALVELEVRSYTWSLPGGRPERLAVSARFIVRVARGGAWSEFEARADGVGDERLAKAGADGVLGPPSGAVGRDDDTGGEGAQVVEDERDEGLEDRPVEMESAHDRVEGALVGQAAGVAADGGDSRVAAAGDHQQALVFDVDDERLIVEDEGVGLPAAAGPGLLRREPGLVTGGAGHFAGDQDRSVEQETGLLFFDDLKARAGERPAAGGRDLLRVAAGEGQPAPAPEVGGEGGRKREPDGAQELARA